MRPAARAELHTHSEGRDAGRVRDAEMGVASHRGRVGRPPFVRRYCLLVIKGLSQSRFFARYARTHVALPSAHTRIHTHYYNHCHGNAIFTCRSDLHSQTLKLPSIQSQRTLGNPFPMDLEKVQKMKRKEPYC